MLEILGAVVGCILGFLGALGFYLLLGVETHLDPMFKEHLAKELRLSQEKEGTPDWLPK